MYNEDRDFRYSTETEWDNADASQQGYEHPERAWVVTDRDVVHANPYYKGSPRCHPDCDCNGEGPLPGCYTNPPQPRPPAPPAPAARPIADDEIPF